MPKTETLEQFRDRIKAQGVPRVHVAVRCPMCGTVQSMHDLIQAGAGKNMEEVEKYIAFSCVGRWTGAGSPRKDNDGKPCNWSLGGLFQLHNYEVVTPDGEKHQRFEPVSPEEAQAHMNKKAIAA